VLSGGAADEVARPQRGTVEEVRRPFVPALRRTRAPAARPGTPETQPLKVLDLSGPDDAGLPARSTTPVPASRTPTSAGLRRLFSTDGEGQELDQRLVAVALAVVGALVGIVLLLRGR
jgi:hypothetical protein